LKYPEIHGGSIIFICDLPGCGNKKKIFKSAYDEFDGHYCSTPCRNLGKAKIYNVPGIGKKTAKELALMIGITFYSMMARIYVWNKTGDTDKLLMPSKRYNNKEHKVISKLDALLPKPAFKHDRLYRERMW